MSDDKICTCDGLREAIYKGLKKMRKKNAPMVMKALFVNYMEHGMWVNCKCEARKENEGI